MEWLEAFAQWAWARHHNPWSWHIRPLFIIPFCFFAYRRSVTGMIATVVALATSMFWFPAPETPDARAAEFLRIERDYLLGDWPWWKILLGASVPLWFVWLAAAFWRRSFLSGALAVTAAMLGKIAWSFFFGGESAWTLVPSALIGLALCYAAIYALYRYNRSTGGAA